jgi:chemotaxis protein CheZ
MEQLIDGITEDLVKNVRDTVSRTIRKKLKASLNQAWGDGEFYKRLNADMLSGLQNIFREINSAKKDGPATSDNKGASELFSEASHQLDEILISTEKATATIIDKVEKNQEMLEKLKLLAAKAEKEKLSATDLKAWHSFINSQEQDLSHVLTALSFQDLTGQRVKKVLSALQTIESTVFELYMSTGIAIKEYTREPEKDMNLIQSHAKQVASELKGPTRDSSQESVDDLLAQLGL